MDRRVFRETLRGNLIPLVTPFRSDLTLDLDKLRQLVRRFVDAGYQKGNGALLAGGAAGEFFALSLEERKRLAEVVVEEAAGRIGILVGAQSANVQEILEMARFSERIGADGIQVSPTYYEHPSREDIFDLFKMISDTADVPQVLYNTFWTGTSTSLDHDLIGRLLEVSNVGGLKWCAPTMHEYDYVLRDFAEDLAIVDNMVCETHSHMMGAVGVVNHVPLFWTEHGLELWQHLEQRRYIEALEMINKIRIPLFSLFFKVYAYSGSEGLFDKVVMAFVGKSAGPPRPLAKELTPELYHQIWQLLNDIEAPGLQPRADKVEY